MAFNWAGSLFVSIFLIIVGVLLIIAGPVAYVVIHGALDSGVEDNVVLDGKDDSSYQGFLSNGEQSDPLPLSKFYLFNVTNLPDVLSGTAVPIVEQVGPYIYKQVDDKVDVEFYDDGNEVSYKWYTHYHYLEELDGTTSAPETDLITTINPAYLAVLAKANNRETALSVGVFAQFMNTTMTSLSTTFLQQASLGAIPLTLTTVRNQVNAAFITNFEHIFDDIFATGEYGILATLPLPHGTLLSNWAPDWPTNVSLPVDSVADLFDPSKTNSFTASSTFGSWLLALQDPAVALLLQKTWGIDAPTQQTLSLWLLKWRTNFLDLLLAENFFPVAVEDLGFAQWGSLALTSPASVYFLDDSVTFFIEFAAWSSFVNNDEPIQTFSADEAKAIFLGNPSSGSAGFIHPEEVGRFLGLLQQSDFTNIGNRYGFTPIQAGAFYAYYQYVISKTLGAALNAGGGLFTTHTARDFLFHYVDPLLALVQPESSLVTVNRNSSSIEEVQANTARYETRYTGKGNIDQIQWYKVWNGLTSIDHWNGGPEVFTGSSANNFAPKIDKDDLLDVYSGSLERNIQILYVQDFELEGIKTYEYTIPASTFQSAATNPANARYYAEIDGFHNMTSAELLPGASGVPLFLSKPHMMDVDPTVVSKVRLLVNGEVVEGMQPNPDIHDSYIRIEPISGTAFDYRKALQANIHIIPEMFDMFHPNMPDMFLPVYYKEESTTLTSKQADDFKSTVYGAIDTALGLLVGFLVAGILLLGLGIFVLVIGMKNKGIIGAGGVPPSSSDSD